MSLFEAYLFLFTDSLLTTLILVPNTLMVFPAMLIFGEYNFPLMVIITILGNIAGITLNYGLGRLLNKVKKEKFGESAKYSRLRDFAQKKLFFLSFFSFIPLFGVLITTFLGLMKVNYLRYIIFAAIGRLLYICLIV